MIWLVVMLVSLEAVSCMRYSYPDGEVDMGVFYNNVTEIYGGQEIRFRVINGRVAKLGDVPYQVGLMRQIRRFGRYQAFCGGSIIKPQKVLTAAHCVEGRKSLSSCNKGSLGKSDFKKTMVVAGMLKTTAQRGEQGQWRSVQKGRYPWNYRFPKHDICVLTLTSPFTFNAHVSAVPYARKKIDYGELAGTGSFGLICRISGYGRINDRGDSGGPLLCKGTTDPAEDPQKGVLVGVVSGKLLTVRLSSFFTRVSSYYKFVDACDPTTRISLLLFLFVIIIQFNLSLL